MAAGMIRAGTLVELKAQGSLVVQAGTHPVAVFLDGETPHAVDNRCPHMGFPLSRGSVKDCVLTCHWHQARFDLASGSAFDLFADDVPAYDCEVRNGDIFVAGQPREVADAGWHRRRLRRGLEHDIGLVIAKSVTGMLDDPAASAEVVRETVRFAVDRGEGPGSGLILVAIIGRLLPRLSVETAGLALIKAVTQVAADRDGVAPRRPHAALATATHGQPKLAEWFRFAVGSRARDGAARVLQSSLGQGATDAELTALLCGADADRIFQAIGHPFDAANKAVELAALADPAERAGIFAQAVDGIVNSRGQEENAGWHHPVEIVEPLRAAEGRIAERIKAGKGKAWNGSTGLATVLEGDDPLAIISCLDQALGDGAAPADLARRVALAAAGRLARFSPTNEVGDWFSPQHAFIYSNAVACAVGRAPVPAVIRAVFHAALAVYMDRFLNVPPAPPPTDLESLPTGEVELRAALLDSFDRRSDPALAPRLVARWLRSARSFDGLVDALAYATAREDLDFHPMQVLEAGVRQADGWGHASPEAELVMCGVARQLASFCPTRRAGLQTAVIARRLHRGEALHEGGG